MPCETNADGRARCARRRRAAPTRRAPADRCRASARATAAGADSRARSRSGPQRATRGAAIGEHARAATTAPSADASRAGSARSFAPQRAFITRIAAARGRRVGRLPLPAAMLPEVLLGRLAHAALERREYSLRIASTSCSVSPVRSVDDLSNVNAVAAVRLPKAHAEEHRRVRVGARTPPDRAASSRGGRRS